ncbi:MAG: NnrS family protein, partial [Hyphomicrobiaceae bacterium]
WAVLTVALWLPLLSGRLTIPSSFAPIEWHAHELIYGYVPAVVAGFLLTAVPNWTGRLPVTGTPLLALVLLWLAGRIGILLSGWIGSVAAAAIDIAFLMVLGAVIARELAAGKDTRNLKVLIGVLVLLGGNLVFHIEAGFAAGDGYGLRIGIAATLTLIMMIGGRIVPSFTRNWLARRGQGRLPQQFGTFDKIAIAAGIVALSSWVVGPQHAVTGVLCAAASLFQMIRLARWAGDRTTGEPLVLILHLAYAFVPLGFALVAFGILQPSMLAPSTALHAWTVGAIGLMTLAVMTRASLGHTNRPLTATPATQLVYLCIFVAAIARLAATYDPAREVMLHVSAAAWIMAFAGFVAVYGPMLVRARA